MDLLAGAWRKRVAASAVSAKVLDELARCVRVGERAGARAGAWGFAGRELAVQSLRQGRVLWSGNGEWASRVPAARGCAGRVAAPVRHLRFGSASAEARRAMVHVLWRRAHRVGAFW
jgi:hypothetical protein